MVTEGVTALLLEEARSSTHWLIAFSGGADSCLLLALAAEAAQSLPRLKITAWYLHHYPGKTETERAAVFAGIAQRYGAPLGSRFRFITATADIARTARRLGYSWEHTASLVRRKRLAQLCGRLSTDGRCSVLTGHNLSDYQETLLLRQQRKIPASSWPANLVRDPVTGFLRPLMSLSRSAVRDAALERHIRWFEDASNQDTSIRRNAVRAQLESGALKPPAFTSVESSIAAALVQVHARELHADAAQWQMLGKTERARLVFYAWQKLRICNRFSRNHFASAHRLPFAMPPFFVHSERQNGCERIVFRRGLGAYALPAPGAAARGLRGDQVTRSLTVQKPYGRKSVAKIFSEMRLSPRQRRLTHIELTADGSAAQRIDFPAGVTP